MVGKKFGSMALIGYWVSYNGKSWEGEVSGEIFGSMMASYALKFIEMENLLGKRERERGQWQKFFDLLES